MKTLIIGAGEIGYNIAANLAHEGVDVTIIDKNTEILRFINDNIDVKTVVGSGTNPSTLINADIDEIDLLLAVANSDEINLTTCLMADILSPSIKKIARIRSNSFKQYYKKFKKNVPHISKIINPEVEIIKNIEKLINFPGTTDIIDFANGNIKFVGMKLSSKSILAETKIYKLSSKINGITPLIVAIIRNEKLIIPNRKNKLKIGDLIYFITIKNKLADSINIFNPDISPKKIKRMLIVGGGTIGYTLAKKMESTSILCKIIEKNQNKCKYLAKKLNKTIVLYGDGSDQTLLNEENISKTDLIITVTNNEETNILISLLAKRMGAKITITRVNKFNYSYIIPNIGIEQTINSRLSAVNKILEFIRKKKVLSSIPIKGESGEIMEVLALPTSNLVLKPLKKIILPKEAMITSIIRRNDIIIPNRNSIIEAGDRVIIFTKKRAIPKIESALAVKLEYF